MIVLVCVAFMCRAMIVVLRRPMATAKREANGSYVAPKHESPKVKMARKQTIIFLGLIVGSLMVCWLPNQIRRLMMAAVPKSRWTVSYFHSYVTLHPIADTFFYLSSVVNPFLYNLSSRQFRQVFLQVLRCHLTIEHANKRTVVPSSHAASARSIQPLLFKSLRRSRGDKSVVGRDRSGKTFTTFQQQEQPQQQSDSGIGSETQQSLNLTEEADSSDRSSKKGLPESEV